MFSTGSRVLDVLTFGIPGHLRPLVDGWYEQRLRSIKPGTSVSEMHRLLGKEPPRDDFIDNTGRRVLTFVYQGAGPEFWVYETDATSGKVIKAWVSEI
jgi:hypothetical protein